MAIRAIVVIVFLLASGCSAVQAPTSQRIEDHAEIPSVNVDVEVQELPGPFQQVE